MYNIQQLYGAKYYILVQERKQNVHLKNINLTYKFLYKTLSLQLKTFVGNINFFYPH